MGKYYPLKEYLENQLIERGSSVTLSFDEIETIIGDSLPKSALVHDQWWENSFNHSQAKSWRSAGYETTDITANKKRKRMTFIRKGR